MFSDTKQILGLQEILPYYDVFIFDLWGVVHDGVKPFHHSIQALRSLKAEGKIVLILSNSPRRRQDIADHLSSMTINDDLYNGLYTSGEDCYDRLRLRDHPWFERLGTAFFHIGTERNLDAFRSLDYVCVPSPQAADFVLCSGTDGWCKSSDQFHEVLEQCLQSRLPMICANHDLSIQRDGEFYICSGALAKYYEKKGGDVFYHGKPSPFMYQRLIDLNNVTTPKKKVVMIGDSLLTDIQGANSFGIDSVLIKSGVHLNQQIDHQTFLQYAAFPTWMMDYCTW